MRRAIGKAELEGTFEKHHGIIPGLAFASDLAGKHRHPFAHQLHAPLDIPRGETHQIEPTLRCAPLPGDRIDHLPGFAFDFWIGLLAPSKTPKPVLAKLNAEVLRIVNLPEVKERMATLGAEPMPMSPEQFDAYIKDEYNTLGAVMRSAPKQ